MDRYKFTNDANIEFHLFPNKKTPNLTSGVNIKKYDNDKVASIAGSHVMLYGLILIFLSGVNYILLDSNATNIINITMLMSTFAIVIGIYYKINKYAKVDISND